MHRLSESSLRPVDSASASLDSRTKLLLRSSSRATLTPQTLDWFQTLQNPSLNDTLFFLNVICIWINSGMLSTNVPTSRSCSAGSLLPSRYTIYFFVIVTSCSLFFPQLSLKLLFPSFCNNFIKSCSTTIVRFSIFLNSYSFALKSYPFEQYLHRCPIL